MNERFNSVSPWPEPLQVQLQHIRSTSCILKCIQILMKVAVKEGGVGGGGWGAYFHSKVTGWAGWAPKTIFLGPASFRFGQTIKRRGEVQTRS